MRTITLVYERHHYLYRWLKPLLAARHELEALGYHVEYQSLWDYLPVLGGRLRRWAERTALSSACRGQHDIVMMAFHHSTSELCQLPAERRAEVLRQVRAHCRMLVWLDTADSTGTCMFDVMPYVDLYLKKQLLTDRSLYCRPLYGSRLYCDYYHQQLGLDDPVVTARSYPLLEPQYLDKLRLAWNVGLSDLFAVHPLRLLLHPYSLTRPDFRSPDAPRTLDVQYRGTGYSPVAGYPRSHSRELLGAMSGLRVSDMTHRLSKGDFAREGRTARCILSPFGWGEICGRDFEAMAHGACLLKQDMNHCETFPDAYQPGSTYVPLRWDFSDFETVVARAASPEYRDVARRAQQWYRRWFEAEGRRDFARHVVAQLQPVTSQTS